MLQVPHQNFFKVGSMLMFQFKQDVEDKHTIYNTVQQKRKIDWNESKQLWKSLHTYVSFLKGEWKK